MPHLAGSEHQSAAPPLIQIDKVAPETRVRTSRFNARTHTHDGTTILYNSYSGSLSGFPPGIRAELDMLLSQGVKTVRQTGIAKYLVDRGFLIPAQADEMRRLRLRAGQQQYKQDELDLILLSSEECNFRCVYCYETFPRGTMEQWVQDSVLQLLRHRVKRLSRFSASYFGGEPLMGLSAIDYLAPRMQAICREEGVPFSSGMTTNGYLLSPEVFARLHEWDVRTYQITIDGAPQDHDEHRVLKDGGGTSEVIISNVLSMQKHSGDFSVAVRVNFDKNNIQRLHLLLDKLNSLKQDPRFFFRFCPIGKWGGANDESLEVCGTTAETERQRLDALATDLGFRSETRLPYMNPKGGMGICYAARPHNLLIGADGKIMKCTVALDTKDYNIVGKLTVDGRADMDLDKFARWVTPYYEEDAVCQKCFYVPVCQGSSCPIPRIEENKRPCPPEKLQIGSTLRNVYDVKQKTARRKAVPAMTS